MSPKYASKRNTYGDLFASWEIAVAKNLILKYERTYRCLKRVHEFEDLLQECLLHWWEVRETYDGTLGASYQTYMGRVVRNKLREIVRHRMAQKFTMEREAESLATPLDSKRPGGAEVGDVLEDRSLSAHPLGRFAARETLNRLLPDLTAQQRQVLESWLLEEPAAELAAELGVHRDTVYAERERIRKRLLHQRLQECDD